MKPTVMSMGSGNEQLGKDWELTDYERQRQPHEIITDNTEIAVSPRSLNSELMCPICLDMLKNTMTAKECLHRFCNECITTALRSTNKECPTCRKKLVSKRSLRPDTNFDNLIAKIYPNRAEYEALQEKQLAKLSKTHSTAVLQKSIEEGMKEQAQIRRHIRKPRPRVLTHRSDASAEPQEPHSAPLDHSFGSEGSSFPNTPSSTPVGHKRKRGHSRESSIEPSASEASYAGGGASSSQREVELVLQPHPDVSLQLINPAARTNRYLKTTSNATIEHLGKYLSIRIQLDAENDAVYSPPSADHGPTVKSETSDQPTSLSSSKSTGKQSDSGDKSNDGSNHRSSSDGTKYPSLSNLTYRLFVRPAVAMTSSGSHGAADSFRELSGADNLDSILAQYWVSNKPLILYFKTVTKEKPSSRKSHSNKPVDGDETIKQENRE